jgi:hypothetical protein
MQLPGRDPEGAILNTGMLVGLPNTRPNSLHDPVIVLGLACPPGRGFVFSRFGMPCWKWDLCSPARFGMSCWTWDLYSSALACLAEHEIYICPLWHVLLNMRFIFARFGMPCWTGDLYSSALACLTEHEIYIRPLWHALLNMRFIFARFGMPCWTGDLYSPTSACLLNMRFIALACLAEHEI